MKQKTAPTIEDLATLIETLRGKNGCPWDQEQTPVSMFGYLMDETKELEEAIETKISDDVCEELGDVLFQLLFIAAIFKEKGDFTLQDSITGIYEKMIRRHPHVFAGGKVNGVDDVKKQWLEIKAQEKGLKI